MKSPATNTYPALVKHVRQELQSLELFIKRHTAQSYWQVGKYIHEYLLANRQRADYGNKLYDRLSRDAGRDRTLLQRTVQFYRAYPIRARGHKLGWSHYRTLVTVKDKSQRTKLEEEALRKDWNAETLQKHLTGRRRINSAKNIPAKSIARLAFNRGQINTFRVVEPMPRRSIHKWLDLGFRVRRELKAERSRRFSSGDRVEIRGTRAVKTSAYDQGLFTYQARAGKIIDGDTIYAAINLISGIVIEQKLRLRGIDCPERDTPEGQRAKRFVEARLKNLEWIIVKTHKDTSDKYDRYLADIFYLPDEDDARAIAREGRFLNQELLDERLATVFKS